MDLDAATLSVSYDYGIMASEQWKGNSQGFANLPASVQALYSANYLKTVNFTLENGSIVQGQGNGTNSSPLFFEGLNGLTVNDVTTYDTGVDTTNLDGRYLGNITITNSTFQDNIPNVTNRMYGPRRSPSSRRRATSWFRATRSRFAAVRNRSRTRITAMT